MSTDPAGTLGTAVSNSPTIPAAPTMTYGQNATLEKMPNEIFRMIANELGEREKNSGMYHSFKSLANFILAVNSGKDVLEEYLYTEDILSNTLRGFLMIFRRNDELAVAVLSKYPVVLVKLHVNNHFTRIVQGKKATWTLLHMAVANRLEKTITKLHELGALYQDTKNFEPVFNRRLDQALGDHTGISHHPLSYDSEDSLWKPGYISFRMDDEETYALLARLWERDAYSVATYTFRYSIRNNYPKPLLHLAIDGQDNMSLRWTKYAARTFPGWVEAPCGETRSSPLHVALDANNRPVLKFLLERGIGFGPHFVDTNGDNPFHKLIKKGATAFRAKDRAEWRKLKDVFFNTVPQLEWNTLMVQTQHPYNSALQLAIENIRYDWVTNRVAITETIKFVLKQEMILLEKWNFPPRSLLVNLPNANGDTPLSRLVDFIENRESTYAKTLWDLFDLLIDVGADINLDVNAIFTPKSYQHSLVNRVHRRRKFLEYVYDLGGEEHRAEIDENYPVSTPTNMETYKLHAHQLPPGNPLNLPMPFTWPLLPVPSMAAGVVKAILYRERKANYAITGDLDLSPYFAHIREPSARPTIAAATTNSAPAAASAAEVAQNEQHETRA